MFLRALLAVVVGFAALYLAAPTLGLSQRTALTLGLFAVCTVVVAAEMKPVYEANNLLKRGRRLVRHAEMDEAIAVFDEYLTRYGHDRAFEVQVAWALSGKGTALAGSKHPADALPVFDEVLNRFGNSTKPRVKELVAAISFNKAVALGALGRPEEEVEGYDALVERFGDSWDSSIRDQVAQALLNKALTLDRMGQSEAAVDAADVLGPERVGRE